METEPKFRGHIPCTFRPRGECTSVVLKKESSLRVGGPQRQPVVRTQVGGLGPQGRAEGGPRHLQERSLQGLHSGSLWTECTPTFAPLTRSLSPRRAWTSGRTLPGMQGFCGWECMCPGAGSFLLLGQWAAAQAWFGAYWERTSAAYLGVKGPGGSSRLSMW